MRNFQVSTWNMINMCVLISAIMVSFTSAFTFSSTMLHGHGHGNRHGLPGAASRWGFSSGTPLPVPSTSPALLQRRMKMQLKSNSNADNEEVELELEGLTFSSNSNKAADVSKEWAAIIKRDGVLKINSALSTDLADALRYYIEDQKILAWFAGMEGEEAAAKRVFYGGRHQYQKDDGSGGYSNLAPVTDLQLSLLRGGYAGDYSKNVTKTERHILADVLLDVLGPEEGTLTSLAEGLVSSEGMMCELAAFVTEPVSGDSSDGEDEIHMASDDSDSEPLYSIALALDDITENMGPMKYSLRSSTSESSGMQVRVGTMKKGDAIVYDARVKRSQGANDATAGSTQTSFLMNISFQNSNPTSTTNGATDADDRDKNSFSGSIRPGYKDALSLGDLTTALLDYDNGNGDAFEKYGDGMSKHFYNTESSPPPSE